MNTAGMHQRGATKSTLGSSVAVIIIVIALLTAVPVGAQTPIPQLAQWSGRRDANDELDGTDIAAVGYHEHGQWAADGQRGGARRRRRHRNGQHHGHRGQLRLGASAQ